MSRKELNFHINQTEYLKVRHSKQKPPTPFEELAKTPVVIHTHHVVRRNDFQEGFLTYKGRERRLFIFDEAMFCSLTLSEPLVDSLHHLDYAITEGETGSTKGLPVGWLEAFRDKLKKAGQILEGDARVTDVEIEMVQLSERFVKTGFYLKDSRHQNFIHTLMNIGAATDWSEIHLLRETGGPVLFGYKVNDTHRFRRVINTDATRSVRRVHDYGSGFLRYPIPPPTDRAGRGVTYWIAPFKSTGKDAVNKDPLLHIIIANLWLKMVKPEEVLVIRSKDIDLDNLAIDQDRPEVTALRGLITAAVGVETARLSKLPMLLLLKIGIVAKHIPIDFGHPK